MRYKLHIQYFAVDSAARALAIAALGNGGGSEGGTSDYNELDNKPSINGRTIIGDKTPEDLGLVGKTYVDNQDLAEKNRAIAKENLLNALIDSEASRAIAVEGSIIADLEVLDDDVRDLEEEVWNSEGISRIELLELLKQNKLEVNGPLSLEDDTLDVKVDDMTIFVNSEGQLEASITPFEVGEGLQMVDDVLSAKVDGLTIVINSEGAISATDSAKTDDITIKRNADNELYVPIDLDTITISSEGELVVERPTLNGVELKGNKTSQTTNITWFGTKDQYDAIAVKNPETIYIIDTSEGYIPLLPDYNNAANKPKINGVELSGNKTTSDLGLQSILSSGIGLSLGNNVLDVNVTGCVKVDTSNRLYIDLTAIHGYDASKVQMLLNYEGVIKWGELDV